MTRATINAVRPEAVKRASAGSPGLVLGGKYLLEEPIARGGMARVWRARHVTLNRPVAVKFIEALGATAEEQVNGFLKEAKVAASVRHKNVVDILDFGVVATSEGDDEPYMVMELLEGQGLDARLGQGPIETPEVIGILCQILNGLDAVHRTGIVHRDLKPGNVFLTDDQDGVFARLLDFGISQGAGDEHAAGIVVGTPEYMSPEQAFGDPLDARSDLYSVGVIAYEMLTGIVPFDDPDPQKIVHMVAHGTIPTLRPLRPDVPQLCDVVTRAMSRDPEDRYESARAMRRAVLEAGGDGPETTGRHAARPTPDPRSSGTHQRITQSTQPLEPATEGSLDRLSDVSARPDPRRTSGERSIRQSRPEGEISVAPPAPTSRRNLGIAIAGVLAIVIAAAAWAAYGRSTEAVAPTSMPTRTATPEPAPSPEPAPPPASTAIPEAPPAPLVVEPSPGVEPPATPPTETEPSAAPRSRERAAPGQHGSPDSPRVRREIVHELDF